MSGGLFFREREALGEPEGLLILHHGRGTDETDLLPLGDVLDPTRRLHVVTPRGPLTLEGMPGRHWYTVPRVGHPDPETFATARAALAELHDELWRATGLAPERTVLGGFSMGSVMSYALGLDELRPTPAGILAFSGFIPDVAGWEPDPDARPGLPALVSHGRRDPVIPVALGRAAAERLEQAGLDVRYLEFDGAHEIPATIVMAARAWLSETLGLDGGGSPA
jgi:phospholipase/carboxylesterase